MPFYEYRCSACGHELEVMQRMNDAPLRVCPACGSHELTKLISAAGFRLKGGGWYETDFKSGGNKKNVHDTGAKEAKGADETKPKTAKEAKERPAGSASSGGASATGTSD